VAQRSGQRTAPPSAARARPQPARAGSVSGADRLTEDESAQQPAAEQGVRQAQYQQTIHQPYSAAGHQYPPAARSAQRSYPAAVAQRATGGPRPGYPATYQRPGRSGQPARMLSEELPEPILMDEGLPSDVQQYEGPTYGRYAPGYNPYGVPCCDYGCQATCRSPYGMCTGDCGGCGDPTGVLCGACPGPNCPLSDVRCDWCWWQDLTVFGGVHGFTGPVDLGFNGNFGFHEGLNYGMPLWHALGLGGQFGVQVVHSDFYDTPFYGSGRTQFFLTTGLFHRPKSGQGWQGGLVFDFLSDNFYTNIDVAQVRGEISFLFPCHELGFWFTANVKSRTIGEDRPPDHFDELTQFEQQPFLPTIRFEPIDMYAFFYRGRLASCGEWRAFGGFTGDSQGLVGSDFRVPLSDRIALESGFIFLAPRGGRDDQFLKEAWNVGINLVWHPGCRARKAGVSLYRPLFNVADNGSLIVNVK
jgi:hypothetical protein